jgi:hypothetical protein
MKTLFLFPISKTQKDPSGAIFCNKARGECVSGVPAYLESNDLKLERFKEIVSTNIPAFSKKSLYFVVKYLKQLGEKIRIVLVRSPEGSYRHCTLFGQSTTKTAEGKDLYFRLGIEPASEKNPKGRMYIECVESGEKTYIAPEDTKSFEKTMQKFYKEVSVGEIAEKKKKSFPAQKIMTELVPREIPKALFGFQKIEFVAKSFVRIVREMVVKVWVFSRNLLEQTKQQIKKHQKPI